MLTDTRDNCHYYGIYHSRNSYIAKSVYIIWSATIDHVEYSLTMNTTTNDFPTLHSTQHGNGIDGDERWRGFEFFSVEKGRRYELYVESPCNCFHCTISRSRSFCRFAFNIHGAANNQRTRRRINILEDNKVEQFNLLYELLSKRVPLEKA